MPLNKRLLAASLAAVTAAHFDTKAKAMTTTPDTTAQPLDLDSLCANLDKLSTAIMNLPCKMGRAIEMNGASAQVYKEGHRDARHAAIELVNEQVALITQARTARLVEAAQAILPGEKWSKGNDSEGNENRDELACAGINIDIDDFPHQNAVEFYAQTLSAAQARRDAVLSAIQRAAQLDTTASASDDFGPPVPESIIDEIRCYGDYRADNDPRSGPQFGEVIKAMRRHYRAPVAAQQGAAEKHNAVECDSALRAEPAGRVLSAVADLADEEIAEICVHVRPTHFAGNNGDVDYLRYDAAVVRAVCTELASRCRAEGGNTSDNESSDLAAKAPAAQAVAYVTGSDTVIGRESRGLQWVKGFSPFKLDPGTKLYAAPTAVAATTSEDARDAALEEAANAVASTNTLGMTAASAITKLCANIRALKSESAMRANQQEGGNA